MIYLSGPMANYADHNRPAFAWAASALRASGVAVLNPAELPSLPDGTDDWSAYLRRDLLELLQRCTGVAVLEDWECSRGAQLEVHVAQALAMPVLPWRVWREQALLDGAP